MPYTRRLIGLWMARAIGIAIAVLPGGALAQDVGVVSGRVVDAAGGRGVDGVLIEISGVSPAITNGAGYFVLQAVPAGESVLQVSHIGFGDHTEFISLVAGTELSLTIRISTEAIELEPFVVEADSELEERRRFSGSSINEIRIEEIEEAARTGMDLADLLQTSMPGASSTQTGRATTCVQYRAIRTGGTSGCREVSVFLDGVQVASPAYLYQTMPLSDIERIEMLSPGQAGLRYGTASGQGVLLIETKQGERVRRADVSQFITGFEWTNESNPYPWAEVFGKTFVVNALLVTGSLLLADNCLTSPEVGGLGLRTRCNGFNTASVGLLSVGMPSLAGGFVSRRAGQTDRTQGRIAPSALAAGMTLTGGYLLVIHGGAKSQKAGYAVLGAGVPLTFALADRIFRVLR